MIEGGFPGVGVAKEEILNDNDGGRDKSIDTKSQEQFPCWCHKIVEDKKEGDKDDTEEGNDF